MKNLFYFLFGVFTILILLIWFIVNENALPISPISSELYELIWHGEGAHTWKWICRIVVAIYALFCFIFIFMLGKGTSHEETKDPYEL